MAQTKGFRRMPAWWLATAVTLGVIGWIGPQHLEVVVWKLLMLTVGVKVGYYADRLLFRNAPPIDSGMARDNVTAARLVCRAIIVYAAMSAFSGGL